LIAALFGGGLSLTFKSATHGRLKDKPALPSHFAEADDPIASASDDVPSADDVKRERDELERAERAAELAEIRKRRKIADQRLAAASKESPIKPLQQPPRPVAAGASIGAAPPAAAAPAAGAAAASTDPSDREFILSLSTANSTSAAGAAASTSGSSGAAAASAGGKPHFSPLVHPGPTAGFTGGGPPFLTAAEAITLALRGDRDTKSAAKVPESLLLQNDLPEHTKKAAIDGKFTQLSHFLSFASFERKADQAAAADAADASPIAALASLLSSSATATGITKDTIGDNINLWSDAWDNFALFVSFNVPEQRLALITYGALIRAIR
jgi:hypothetical protein